MNAPRLYLVDNTRAIDPTLPDLHDCIPDNTDARGEAIVLMLVGFIRRASGVAFWIAVGVVGAMVL